MTINPYEPPQILPLATPAPPPPLRPASWRRGLGTFALFLSALFGLLTMALLMGYLYQRWNGFHADTSFFMLGAFSSFLSLLFWFMGRLFFITDPALEESSDE